MIIQDEAQSKQDLLTSIYFNPRHPASFSSVRKLYLSAKQLNNNITLSDVRRYLHNSHAYTSHKPIHKRYLRRKTIVRGINDQWQLDLLIMANLKNYNSGFSNVLVAIDCFSRYAYAEPLQTKKADETLLAFKTILIRAGTKPRIIQTDSGSEFKASFRQFLDKNNIHYFTTSQDTKCAIVERFIQTLEGKIYKYLDAKNTLRYVDVLQSIIFSYNHSKHRSLGVSPVNVTAVNEDALWNKQYRNYLYSKSVKSLFNVGDKVRITKYRKTFQRGYLSNWRTEIFQIAFRLKTYPVTYILIDKENEIIRGGFYSKELVKIEGA